jgi:hypothetical protein
MASYLIGLRREFEGLEHGLEVLGIGRAKGGLKGCIDDGIAIG